MAFARRAAYDNKNNTNPTHDISSCTIVHARAVKGCFPERRRNVGGFPRRRVARVGTTIKPHDDETTGRLLLVSPCIARDVFLRFVREPLWNVQFDGRGHGLDSIGTAGVIFFSKFSMAASSGRPALNTAESRNSVSYACRWPSSICPTRASRCSTLGLRT